MDDRTCTIDGCEKKRKGRYCPMHRDRIARHGSPDGRPIDPRQACAFTDCDRLARSMSLCSGHYAQLRRGKPLAPIAASSFRDDEGRKHCPKCNQWKAEAEFSAGKRTADLLTQHCTACIQAAPAAWAATARYQRMQKRMGITREAFDALFARQGERCAICKSPDSGARFWSIDHDHSCCSTPGRSCGQCVRGILCTSCNVGIGMLKDDPEIALAAHRYLRGAL